MIYTKHKQAKGRDKMLKTRDTRDKKEFENGCGGGPLAVMATRECGAAAPRKLRICFARSAALIVPLEDMGPR